MGIREEHGIVYGYGVSFDDLPNGYDFSVDEVTPTGRKIKREDFYDGTSISVSKDGKMLMSGTTIYTEVPCLIKYENITRLEKRLPKIREKR